jgi:PIN domain nuclease of toxin-antitoxin system
LILLDTHAVLWIAEAPELLSPAAVAAIAESRQNDGVAIAGKTLWELAMLVARGRVKIRTTLRDFLEEVEHYCIVLPLTSAIAERSTLFSSRYPSDPADQIIGATALIHGLKLITRDEKIRASGELECVW